jgi:hypothetical protein
VFSGWGIFHVLSAPGTAERQKNQNGGNPEMKFKISHIIRIILLVFLHGICVNGYTTTPALAGTRPLIEKKKGQPEIPVDISEIPNERYLLYTDRTIYAAGEKILFRALNLSPAAMRTPEWSRVLYLELINASQTTVARGKYEIGKRGSSGALVIPATTQTGNYYLRAYTRWMRNYPVEEYASVGLVIINPNNPPARSGQQNYNGNTAVAQPEADSGKYLAGNSEDFRIRTDREEYPARSKVRLEIEIPAGNMPSAYEYSVSVVPALALETRAYDPGKYEYTEISGNDARFYPETRGITLSGRVMMNGRQDPGDFTVVHSSILGKGSGYAGFRTNDQGEFHIVLPEIYGPLNLFVAAETDNGEILIDNDYSTEHAGTVAAYYLSENEKELAAEIMFGAQVESAYDPVPVLADTSSGTVSIDLGNGGDPFYGPPMKTILIDDYVALPSLEEFIVELLPEINILRRKGETSISLYGMHTDIALYPPLILFDYIPVFDIEELLKLTPADVQRIELVNATFSRGDLTFGGIVSVFSRNGDLSGYKLTGASYFFDFEAYNDTKLPVYPDYSGGKGDLYIPDYRNTLLWEPLLSAKPGETKTIEFYTSDRPGEYSIIIRGISGERELLTGEASFRVTTAYP